MTDKDKVLVVSSILKVTIIMIIISVFLKLLGLDFFALERNNEILNWVSYYLEKCRLNYIISFFTLCVNYYVLFRLICKNGKWNYLVTAFIVALVNIIAQISLFSNLAGYYYFIFSTAFVFVVPIIIDRKLRLKRFLVVSLSLISLQVVTLFIRNITFNENYTVLYDLLLNFDYMILLIIIYYLYLKKGRDIICLEELKAAYSYSRRKVSLQKLQLSYQEFSKKTKQQKAEIIIYFFLSMLWETFTLGVLFFVAFLNDTIIECIFIVSAFLITKHTFGTPFHFKSAIACFIVSNLTYYALNRIVPSIGISIIIPIVLGILLSYFTSKLVKKRNTKLYRGMSEEDLLEIVNECNCLNKYEKDILVDFYSNRMTTVAIGMKHNYAEDTIYIHKKKALAKLKDL